MTVANGASLQLQTPTATMTVNQAIVLNGSGVAGNGALESVFGNISLTGSVTLNTAATIGVDGGTLDPGG